MVKIILMIGAIVMLSSSSATAQQKISGAVCVADLKKLCPGVEPGNRRLLNCMREHIHELSSPCLMRLAKFAEVREARLDCGDHIRQQCGNVEQGEGKLAACLKSAIATLSDSCQAALSQAVTKGR